MAFARRGDGDKAVRLLRMLNPVEHAREDEDRERYKVEPYIMAGDVYSLAGHVGRGGWTWYTGAAAWTYRVWLEEVFGFQRRGDTLTINPVIPKEWSGFRSALPPPKHPLSHRDRESRALFARRHSGGSGWNDGAGQGGDVAGRRAASRGARRPGNTTARVTTIIQKRAKQENSSKERGRQNS